MAGTHIVTSDLSPFERRPSGTSHLSAKAAPIAVLRHPPDALRAFILLALASVLCAFTATEVDAQQRPVSGGPRITFPSHANQFSWEGKHGFHGGFGGVFVVQQEVPVIVEREVVRDKPAEPAVAVAPPPAPRKPYVIGSTYASLPGSCMKLIDEGVSYYYCDGEWYQQLGGGRDALFKAVAKP